MSIDLARYYAHWGSETIFRNGQVVRGDLVATVTDETGVPREMARLRGDRKVVLPGGIELNLPSASGTIARLEDITGDSGLVTDGDYGDVEVSASGTVWTVSHAADADTATSAASATVAATVATDDVYTDPSCWVALLTSLYGNQVVRQSQELTFDPTTAGGQLTTAQYKSTVATGTAPLIVASTTVVANLNASYLEGHAASYFQVAGSYQTSDAFLTSIATLGTAADRMIYTTGVDTAAETPITSFGRSLIDDAASSNARTTLGVVIGTDVQAHSSVLDATTASFLTAQETKLSYLTVTQPVDLDDIETRVNNLDAAVVLKGSWDASAGTFPGGGTAQAGASYIVSVAGTVNSVTFNVGDRIIAILDNASTTVFAANWFKADYTDQVLSVFGRVGAVVSATNDYTWAQIDKGTSSLADITTRSAADLSSGLLALARGGTHTDLSATGGASRVLKQVSAGADITVAQLAFTDISGSVAASQMPALTGDVTTVAGAVATTIANNAVTDGKFRQSAGLSVPGRSANTTGNVADITGTDGQVLRVSGTALGFGTVVAAGIASDAVTTVKILDANVTLAKMANLAQDQFIGRVTASTGVPETATITAAARTVLDDTTVGAMRTTMGIGTGDSPQFAGVNVGNASDTTITRAGAGLVSVEGAPVGTVVKVTDLPNNTALASNIAWFTPPVAGMYQIIFTVTCTRAASTSSILGGNLAIRYTTGVGTATAKTQVVPTYLVGSTTATTVSGDTSNAVGTTVIGMVTVYASTTQMAFDIGYASVGLTTMEYSFNARAVYLG